MATIAIIGAGISGPAAALSLATSGHSVTVYERRSISDLHSDAILGVTQDNYDALISLGVMLRLVELPNEYKDLSTGKFERSNFRYVTWTDLHNELVATGMGNGVSYKFNTSFNDSDRTNYDYVVRAGGVGMASKDGRKATYAGYVIVRGTAKGHFLNVPWISLPGKTDSGKFLFNAGDMRDGANFAWYLHRNNAATKTTYSTEVPPEIKDLPSEYRQIVNAAGTYQIAPVSDWEAPKILANSNWHEFTIGDANGAMRPHTSMGANLGITEGLHVIDMINGDHTIETYLATARIAQRNRGIRLGKESMGE